MTLKAQFGMNAPALAYYCATETPFFDDWSFVINQLRPFDSGLEEFFLLTWAWVHRECHSVTYQGKPLPKYDEPSGATIIVDVRNQEKIGRYRLDFLFTITEQKGGRSCQVAVELDGYNYHDRTAKQASSDRRRDRTLLREGIYTLRYTFADLMESPGDAIWDLRETLIALGKRL